MAAPLSQCLARDELHSRLMAWLTRESQTIPLAHISGTDAPDACLWPTDPAAYRREVLNHIRDQAELLLGAAERQHARQLKEKKDAGPSNAVAELARVRGGSAVQHVGRGTSPTKHRRASTGPQPLPTSVAGYSEAFPSLDSTSSTNQPKPVSGGQFVWDTAMVQSVCSCPGMYSWRIGGLRRLSFGGIPSSPHHHEFMMFMHHGGHMPSTTSFLKHHSNSCAGP